MLSFDVEYFFLPFCYPKHIKTKKYRTTVLPVFLYGCQESSLTMKEKHRLRVFENDVLRKIYGPKRDEVIGK